jgi:hypothetical protein
MPCADPIRAGNPESKCSFAAFLNGLRINAGVSYIDTTGDGMPPNPTAAVG